MLREEPCFCKRESGVADKYVRLVQDTYESSMTVLRCTVGVTNGFQVEVGLHQGLALSPFLFVMMQMTLQSLVRAGSK